MSKEVESKEKMNKNKKHTRRNIVLFITLITMMVTYIGLRGSYLEMKEIGDGYLSVFWQDTIYFLVTFICNFVFLFLSFYLTNKTIKKGLKVFFDDEKKEMPKFPNKSISFVIALVGSVLSTNILLKKILLCFSNSKFGINDPVFNFDISFFVLQKPFIQLLLIYLLIVVIGTLAYAIIYSIIILNKSFNGVSRDSITKCDLVGKIKSRIVIIAILVALIVLFFMVINIGNEKFMGVQLSDGNSFSLYGANKSDATVKLIGYVILALLTMWSILRAYKALKEKSVRRVIGNIIIVPVYLIVLAAVLALYQLIFIGSDILASNEKYIEKNIENTKQAYGININENTLNYSGTITEKEIEDNANLLANANIVNGEKVIQDLQTTQSSKGYYAYRNTQIEQYNIEGKTTLAYITPREISNSNSTYSNKTYTYTHGYGSIVTLAGKTDADGYLKNYKKDFNETKENPIQISEPGIYYGLETNSAVVINSSKNEIDYIDEDSNKEFEKNYEGNAGLKLNLIDRIILGIKEKDIHLAFSSNVTSESKILTNRNIINRAKSVMPYLKYDNSPYLVINNNGKQYWVLDAYTVSNDYPFSQKSNFSDLEEINYIRNSVKVIINAYDGSMKFYITDRNDPIIMAYNNIYKDLFAKAEDTIPEDISEHFVYPKMLFYLQSKVASQYHNIKPEVIYRGNDIWQIAETSISGKATEMNSYYTMVKNSEGNDSLGLVIPFTIYNKQNIIAYMVGTYEKGKYVLKINRFSSDSNVLGPIQFESQVNQDESIASEIASLNTTGTKVTKDLFAVPINNTMVYVETIYQQLINETYQKPSLKKVVVASGNKIAIGNNFEQALKNLVSKYAIDIEVANTEDLQELINGIIKANENVKNSSKSSDWKLFGEDMQKLTELIDKLQKVVEDEKKESKDNNTSDGNSIQETNLVTVNETRE